MYLVLDEDGMLRMRYPDGTVVGEIAGPGQELVVVRGQAQLRDGDGTVVWTTARGGLSEAAPPQQPQVPCQHQLEAWVDSLTGERGYCATVVRDLGPAEALRRLGLAGDAVTRVRADGPARRDDMESDFVVHRNGALVAQSHDKPSRRKGVKVPEVAAALADMGSWNAATWARLYGLELMCRVAGVSTTAADLASELLGGIVVVNAQRVNEDPIGYRGVTAGVSQLQESLDTPGRHRPSWCPFCRRLPTPR
jgi:hypothetical protein